MRVLQTFRLLACVRFWAFVSAFTDYGSISPRRYHIGTVHARSELLNWTDSTIVNLTLATPVLTLDFGHEVAGFPYIITQSQSTTAQIEFKYAESFASLESPYSDGPWTFSNGLSNSFRVETFDITQPGRLESFFVQGGQRWMVVTLLTSEDLTIHDVGFRATSPNMDFDKLPGQLNTSNELLDQVFHLGGRVAQAACVDAGNAPSTWEITSQGALVNGQTSAQSALGLLESNYTLTFNTKIFRGGTGWRVASAIEPLGPYFVLTSDYPENNTFINTNRTLMPPNTLIFNSDWGLVNQSTLETTANQYYPVNITIKEETWYHISTSIREAGYEISLDGKLIAFVPIPPPVPPISFFATPSRYQGTWGFGGFQEHITYYKDVNVVLGNGTEIYRNPFMSDEVLAEYNVAPLDTSLCLDGAKRDRLVWTGDFYHTVRVVAQSTARFDQLLGTIKYVFSYRNEDDASPFAGFVPISPRMGSRPRYYKTNQSWGGLVDYQDLLLAGIGEYFRYTGDLEGLRELWPQIKKLAFTKLTFINPTSGLVAGNANTPGVAWFLGPANGSAITGLFAFALDRLVPLANAFQDNEAATAYTKAAGDLRESINKNLWNEELGTYALSIASPGNFSLTGIAWAILSGAANATQIESSIGKLEELRFGVGYKTISSDAETPNYQLAPNPSGFLLEALFQSRRDHGSNSTTAITHLLDNLWGSMVNNDEYASGASWEYVKPDGSPGIDLFTSLAHPWGAAPTYVLPEYLLGVQPTSPGYATFALRPMIGYLGIKEVNGKVPTPKGPIEVGWKIEGHSVSLLVIVPSGVSGVLEFPNSCAVRSSGSVELSEGTKTMVFDLDSDI